MGGLARHPHGTVPDESDRSSSQSQGLRRTVPSSGCRIHHHGAGCTTRNSPTRGDGLCFRLMVFVVAPEKSRDRAIVGDNSIQHQQAADLRLAVLPLLQWLAGAIQGRPQTTFVPATPVVTQAARDLLGAAPLEELHSKIDALACRACRGQAIVDCRAGRGHQGSVHRRGGRRERGFPNTRFGRRGATRGGSREPIKDATGSGGFRTRLDGFAYERFTAEVVGLQAMNCDSMNRRVSEAK